LSGNLFRPIVLPNVHTQGHAIINLAVLGRKHDRTRNWAALLGAVLPDITIVLFFVYHKWVAHIPARAIWSELYFAPGFWQSFIDAFHSIPLALVGIALCAVTRNTFGKIFFSSVLLHALGDIPVHQADAHRHFFPLSDWRFFSPVSYWDPAHHGLIIGLIEFSLVLVSSYFIWKRGLSVRAKGALLLGNLLYLFPLIYLLRRI
jgi:hypothetical protein